MNRTIKRCLLLLAFLASYGCSTGRQNTDSHAVTSAAAQNAESFEVALQDFKMITKVGSGSLFPAITSLRRYYVLPSSIEPVISMGQNAIPLLRMLKDSGELERAQLASACIDIIEAKGVRKAKPRKDPRSGISTISYSVT